MFGNYLSTLAIIGTLAVFYYRGIIFGLEFFVVIWVIVGLLVKNMVAGRQSSIDSRAGSPAGTAVFSIITIIAATICIRL